MRKHVPSASDLDRLISGLYEAAMQPVLWSSWFSEAAANFGGNSGLSLIQDVRTGAADMLSTHNLSSRAVQLYGEYYHQCDLWTQRSGRTLMKATVSADLCTDEEFANSEMYVDFSKPHGGNAFYVVGAVLPIGANAGVIGFQSTRTAGPFTRLHAQALDRLLPHLQRALTIRGKLRDADARDAVSQAVIDGLGHAVLLVTLDAIVVHANPAAQDILRSADGISVRTKGLLIAARPSETNALQALIATCALPAGGGAMCLNRPSGLRPLEVIVAPLAAAGRYDTPHKTAAIAFLRDPEVQPRALPGVLADLYRLTPAEGRLAGDLLAHRTLEEIAEQRGLSQATLRTQLKQLFRKTGTNRQSELVGFLTAGLAATVRSVRPN